jgi:hypothetical protein
MNSEYIGLSTRAGYNRSLNHFRVVAETLNLLSEGVNMADIIEELEKEHMVRKEQIRPILNSVLIEKFQYNTVSFNVPRHISDAMTVHELIKSWNRFETVIVYYHPQLGISAINPQNENHWKLVGDFTAEELIVIFARAFEEGDADKEFQFLEDVKKTLEGIDVGEKPEYNDPKRVYYPISSPEAEPAVSQAVSSAQKAEEKLKKPKGKRKMTPKYSVQVTNELFHNGNVEAWKNIIESYTNRFPELDVFVFHEGKRVNNLNSLFKWGKVKHGDAILFSVAGDNFKDISKLQRYLFEGASSRYEAFMKKDVNKSLNLF